MALIAHCEQIHDSKIITGSRGVARVYEYHILSVTTTKNKSFDVTEINFWLEFADVIFGGTKYVCVRRLVVATSFPKLKLSRRY